jgi:sugar O-acyltransferase (sialic acid O-acetyltransferase NeuD family)
MKKRLILVGGGAFARELINWVDHLEGDESEWLISGYLGLDPNSLKEFDYQIPYLGEVDGFAPKFGDSYLMAIGDPSNKKKAYESLKKKGAHFTQMIHPSAVVAGSAKLGEGVVVCPQAFVSADSVVGPMVAINGCSSIGHDAEIGAFATLSSHVDITGWVKVDERVFFGSGARVLPKVKIGAGSIIGAGAIVMRSVPDNAVMYANPAKKF